MNENDRNNACKWWNRGIRNGQLGVYTAFFPMERCQNHPLVDYAGSVSFPLELVRGWRTNSAVSLAGSAVPSCNAVFLVAAPLLVLVTLHAHGLRMVTVSQLDNKNCQAWVVFCRCITYFKVVIDSFKQSNLICSSVSSQPSRFVLRTSSNRKPSCSPVALQWLITKKMLVDSKLWILDRWFWCWENRPSNHQRSYLPTDTGKITTRAKELETIVWHVSEMFNDA